MLNLQTISILRFAKAFLFCIVIQSATAQTKKADSLTLALSNVKHDSLKIKILFNLSFELRAIDPDKALEYAHQALSIAKLSGRAAWAFPAA